MIPFSGGFFPGGIESTQNGLVLFSVAAAALYLAMLPRPPSPKRTLAKIAGILLLIALAIASKAPDLLVAALAFSAIGDAALAEDSDRAFIPGLGAFLLAHVAYATLFLISNVEFDTTRLLPIAALCVFAFMFGFVLVKNAGQLALPVAVYILAITGMGVAATLHGGAILVGALLFIVSDAILGAEKFLIRNNSPVRRLTGPLIWIFYFAGQITLTISIIKLSQSA